MHIGNTGNGGGAVDFNFAYDPSYFHRSDGTHDQCFDRSRANASLAVWQYGTYNANDGTRVDQAHPGFPVLATSGGNSYYGFANYWGINFQGLDIPDGTPVAGVIQRSPKGCSHAMYPDQRRSRVRLGGAPTCHTCSQTVCSIPNAAS